MVKILVTIVIYLLLFGSLCCNETSNRYNNVDTVSDTGKSLSTNQADTLIKDDIEEVIIETIFKLAEVQKRAEYIEQQTHGKRHLKIWIEETPDLTDLGYYWIKAGEDNGTSLVTHFDFHVYADNLRIMY